MTADDWQTCAKPDAMLKAITAKASGRKLRLIACAVCRRVWETIHDQRSLAAVAAAERYADGRLGEAAFRYYVEHAETAVAAADGPLTARDDPRSSAEFAAAAAAQGATLGNPAAGAAHSLRWATRLADVTAAAGHGSGEQFRTTAAAAIREIVGPLAHPLVLMSEAMLRTYGGPAAAFRARVSGTARTLAAGIAADLAFDRLPILADALDDAGLDDRAVLDHLRYDPGHVRGCWALDLVLGRA